MAPIMELPTEIIQKIYMDCVDIQSVLSLSYTCSRFRAPYHENIKLKIIEHVLETQYGPLYDIIQLITFNSSQPVHFPRRPGMSMDLAAQIVKVGNVVEKWKAIYPSLRWRDQSEYRRILLPREAYRFRRAMYRMWLYGKSFHSFSFLELGLAPPLAGTYPDPRISFMRKFGPDELIEMAELHDVLHEMVSSDLCPSNAMIQRLFSQGFPGQDILYFGSYEAYPIVGTQLTRLPKKVSVLDLPLKWAGEAWGSFEDQRRTVERVLKLLPDQLLHFRENLSGKAERSYYLKSFPEAFYCNSSTFRAAIDALTALRHYHIGADHGIDGGIIDFIKRAKGGKSAQDDSSDKGSDDDNCTQGDYSEIEQCDEEYDSDLEAYYADEAEEVRHVDV